MRTITIREKDITTKTKKKVYKKYKSLSTQQLLKGGATQMGIDLYFTQAKSRVNQGETVFLKFVMEGLEKPLTFKATKIGQEFKIEVDSILNSLDIPLEEREEAVKIASNNSKTLKPTEPYQHPLSDSSKKEGETFINMWQTASFMINTVRNVYKEGSPKQAEYNLKVFLNTINPLADAEALLTDIKLHRLVAMQKVANIIGTAPHESIVKASKQMKLSN